MAELKWGFRVPFGEPVIGEEEIDAVVSVMRSGRLTEGPNVAQFEEEFRDFVGGGMAVAVSSCTAALHLAWMSLGVGPGQRVVVPALTHAATAQAVLATGADIVLCDVRPDGNLDPLKLREVLKPDVTGISVVHFLSGAADVAAIREAAGNRHVVEDCALAVGTRKHGRHVGLFGDVGAFSFYPAKHITTGEGGIVLTRSPERAEEIRLLRAFGKTMSADKEFDVKAFGINYRMNEICCLRS